MRRINFILIAVFTTIIFHAQTSFFQWAKGFGGSGNDYGRSITMDVSGNVYTTGTYIGTVDFDPGPGTFTLSGNTTASVFVSKLDASGNFVWAKKIIANGGIEAYSIESDVSGNIFIAGSFSGVTDFDPGVGTFTLSATSVQEAYILKLDPIGNFVWAKSLPCSNSTNITALKPDPSGNIYATGAFQGTADFDPGLGTYTVTSQGQIDLFVLKLDLSGNFIWAYFAGGTGFDSGADLDFDSSNNIYVTGGFTSVVDFDPGPGTYTLTSGAPASFDVFVLKLDPSGNIIWAKNMGGQADDFGNAVVVDGNNVYTTGTYKQIADFDPGPAVFNFTALPFPSTDCFISKLDLSGNFVWAKSVGGGNNDKGISMAKDITGNIYIAGDFGGTADFDPGAATYTINSTGTYDIFILKLDASGNFLWAIAAASFASNPYLIVDANGNICTTGIFYGNVDFDPGTGVFTLSAFSFPQPDFFIQKLNQCIAQPPSPVNTTSNINTLICNGNTATLSASATGTINWYTSSLSTVVLGIGNNFTTPTLTVGTYTYYAETFSCTTSPRTPITVTVSLCTDIYTSMNDVKQLKIYPNPTRNLLSLEFEKEGNIESDVILKNILGQIILEEKIYSNKHLCDLSYLSLGTYFLTVKNQYFIKTTKILKE